MTADVHARYFGTELNDRMETLAMKKAFGDRASRVERGAAWSHVAWVTTANDFAVYDGPGGVVAAVVEELSQRVDAALAAGIAPERIVVDPGLGFAKEADHNWALLAGLEQVACLGHPILVGASRKSFLGSLLRGPDGAPRPVDERENANTALTAMLAHRPVWALRVHDVRASCDALRVVARLEEKND